MSLYSRSRNSSDQIQYYYMQDRSLHTSSSRSILGNPSFTKRISAYSPTSLHTASSSVSPSIKSRPSTSRQSSVQNISPNFILSGRKISGRGFRQQSACIRSIQGEIKQEMPENQVWVPPSASPSISRNCFNSESSYLQVKSIPLIDESAPKKDEGRIDESSDLILQENEEKVEEPRDLTKNEVQCCKYRPCSANVNKFEKTVDRELVNILSYIISKCNSREIGGESMRDFFAEAGLECGDDEWKGYLEKHSNAEYFDYYDFCNKILFSGRQTKRRILQNFPNGVVLGRLNQTLMGTLQKMKCDGIRWRRLRSDLTRLDDNYSGFISIDKFITTLNRFIR